MDDCSSKSCEENCDCDCDSGCASSKVSEDENSEDSYKTLISHPFITSGKNEMLIMALMFSEGRMFLGGVDWLAGEDLVVYMHAPLSVQEGMVQDPATKQVHQQLAVLPVSFAVGLMDGILLDGSLLYQLKAASKIDCSLVRHYEDKYSALRAMQAGIVAPQGQDIANLVQLASK